MGRSGTRTSRKSKGNVSRHREPLRLIARYEPDAQRVLAVLTDLVRQAAAAAHRAPDWNQGQEGESHGIVSDATTRTEGAYGTEH
jgi:hypothetical protein